MQDPFRDFREPFYLQKRGSKIFQILSQNVGLKAKLVAKDFF